MKYLKLILLILFVSISIGQDFSQSLIEIEKEKYKILNSERISYAKRMILSKILYPGDSQIDVTYYKLNLEVSYEAQYITGAVTVDVKVDTTAINSCFLDLKNSLTVDSVLIDGSLTYFTHTNHELSINLNRTYHQDERFSVQVFYQGHPDTSGVFLPSFIFTTHNGQPVMWTSSEPYSASDWWPCKDTPADKADSSDVYITVSDDLTAVSNGTLEQIINNGDGTLTFYWKNHYPIAHYLISLAITNYYQYNNYFNFNPLDSMIVTHFVYPETFNSNVQAELDETIYMLELFSARFGMYPFIEEKYGHAETEWELMENQTMSSMSWFAATVVAHELAHQWYGDMITCKDWHHVWLNEGFATYAEALYIEAKNGKQAYDQEIQINMNLVFSRGGTIWVEDISDPYNIFNLLIYYKGAVILHMLRGIVGDSTFFNIMKAYSSDPLLAYGTAITEDFQRNAESVFGSSLNYFFQEWIYGEYYPVYNIEWSKSFLGGEIYKINLTISQEENTSPAYFTMPVQIGINTSLGDTVVTLFNNQQVQEFQFEVIGNPLSITFDPGNWIMDKVESISDVQKKDTPTEYILHQNYPNPFNPATTIKYQIPELSYVTLKVYDIIGNEVATLVNGEKFAGNYEVNFDGAELTSGIYFYRFQAGKFSMTKKMMFIK